MLPAALGAAIFIILTVIMSAGDVADEGDDDDADDEDGEQLFKGTPVEMAEAMHDTASEAEFIEYDVWDEVSTDGEEDKPKKKGKRKPSKLQVQRILDVKQLWRNVKILHTPCKFKKGQWKEALKVLQTKQENKVWGKKTDDR